MIIRNPLGSNNVAKTAHNVPAAKNCDICQTAFKQGHDDYRINHCNECVTTNKVANAKAWKEHFASQRLNSLSPEQIRLAEQLKGNDEMLEGRRIHREAATVTDRSLSDVRRDQAKYAASLEAVREQVVGMLPAVLAEYGLQGQYDIEVVADLLVPARINQPIALNANAKGILRSAVFEALQFLDPSKLVVQATIKPNGEIKKAAASDVLLDGGIRRVGDEVGNRVRQIPQIAAVTEHEQGALDDMRDQMHTQDAVRSAEAVPVEDDALGEEDEAAGEPPMGQTEEATAPPDLLHEGIAPVGGGAAEAPEAPDLSQVAYEGIKRIQQAAAPKARLIPVAAPKIAKPKYAEMFTFAGRVPKETPVTSVKLEKFARQIISAHTPINYVTAQYSDSNTRTFSYYKTDIGYLFESPKSDYSFHAKTVNAFLDFIETDPQFVRWAFLPPTPDKQPAEAPEAHAQAPAPQLDDVAEMPHDGEFEVDEFEAEPLGEGAGDPNFNDAPVNTLAPSPNNEMDQQGLMFEQDQLLNNPIDDFAAGDEGFNEAPQDVELQPTPAVDEMATDPEQTLQRTAAQLLPHIEALFPNETIEVQADLAISAALEVLAAEQPGLFDSSSPTPEPEPPTPKPPKPTKPKAPVATAEPAVAPKPAPKTDVTPPASAPQLKEPAPAQPKAPEAPAQSKPEKLPHQNPMNVYRNLQRGYAPDAVDTSGKAVAEELAKRVRKDHPMPRGENFNDVGSDAVPFEGSGVKNLRPENQWKEQTITTRRPQPGVPGMNGATEEVKENVIEPPSKARIRDVKQRLSQNEFRSEDPEKLFGGETKPEDVDAFRRWDKGTGSVADVAANDAVEQQMPKQKRMQEGLDFKQLRNKMKLLEMYIDDHYEHLSKNPEKLKSLEDSLAKTRSKYETIMDAAADNAAFMNRGDHGHAPMATDEDIQTELEALHPTTAPLQKPQREIRRRDDGGDRSLYNKQKAVEPKQEKEEKPDFKSLSKALPGLLKKEEKPAAAPAKEEAAPKAAPKAKAKAKAKPSAEKAEGKEKAEKPAEKPAKKTAPKKKSEDPKAAAIADHLMFVTANAQTQEDIEFGIDALVQAGFSIDDIIRAQALLKVAEDCDDVYGATHAVKDVADSFGEADMDEARGLHNAKTVKPKKIEQHKNNPN